MYGRAAAAAARPTGAEMAVTKRRSCAAYPATAVMNFADSMTAQG